MRTYIFSQVSLISFYTLGGEVKGQPRQKKISVQEKGQIDTHTQTYKILTGLPIGPMAPIGPIAPILPYSQQ